MDWPQPASVRDSERTSRVEQCVRWIAIRPAPGRTMNLLFRIVYAAHANGTHHKLALDALRYLENDAAEKWQRLFLAHADVYMEGSKAPDKQFKDFKNHVLHVQDDYWGGAPEKVESWYNQLVKALKTESWHEAVWCAGIMSHYYTDPIHPFHTAQSKAESDIHRAVEWSISKSYDQLYARARRGGVPEIRVGEGETWIKDHVIAGAETSNAFYETLITHYDFKRGVVDPPDGLDETSRGIVAGLLIYAAAGHARLLDRAIAEAGVEAPDVTLTAETVVAALKIPLRWVTRKLADAGDRRQVEAMYDEWLATGSVEQTLSEDDRQVRDLYQREVVAPREAERSRRRELRRAASPLPQGQIPKLASAMNDPRPPEPERLSPDKPANELASLSHEATQRPATAVPIVAPGPGPGAGAGAGAESLSRLRARRETEKAPAPSGEVKRARVYLSLTDEVEAAPSIGPKTAARLETIGIITVGDLLDANPEEAAEELATRHITARTIRDWQDQALLVTQVPGLRGTHAQLLVGAGLRTLDLVADAEPTDAMAALLKFATSDDGKRVLRDGPPPDVEKLRAWIESAREVKQAA